MATSIPAAKNRLFKNVFVCKHCGQKMKANVLKIIAKKVTCRKCKRHNFRPMKSKKK
jgi:Zn finger protein HypA/HybF involved in hydrogenase expression